MPRSSVRGFSGARLRRARHDRGLTADDLADLAGVSPQVLSAWETGRYSPTPQLLRRVADALHVTIADLVVLAADKSLLSDLRTQAGLTQSESAARVGVSPSTLARIEKGRKGHDPAVVQVFADLYSVTVERVERSWDLTVATRAAHLRSL